jgi:hypothetical protein
MLGKEFTLGVAVAIAKAHKGMVMEAEGMT